MATVDVACVQCRVTDDVVKNGKAKSGLQRFLCRTCKKSFQLDYLYNGNRPGTHEPVVEMAMNGSGVRDTGRVLGISPTTVMAHLKNWRPGR